MDEQERLYMELTYGEIRNRLKRFIEVPIHDYQDFRLTTWDSRPFNHTVYHLASIRVDCVFSDCNHIDVIFNVKGPHNAHLKLTDTFNIIEIEHILKHQDADSFVQGYVSDLVAILERKMTSERTH